MRHMHIPSIYRCQTSVRRATTTHSRIEHNLIQFLIYLPPIAIKYGWHVRTFYYIECMRVCVCACANEALGNCVELVVKKKIVLSCWFTSISIYSPQYTRVYLPLACCSASMCNLTCCKIVVKQSKCINISRRTHATLNGILIKLNETKWSACTLCVTTTVAMPMRMALHSSLLVHVCECANCDSDCAKLLFECVSPVMCCRYNWYTTAKCSTNETYNNSVAATTTTTTTSCLCIEFLNSQITYVHSY